MAIVIMGVSGSGKSTLGALLAERLGCAFLEGDTFHSPAAIAQMQVGRPLDDLDRWPWLDRIGAALDAEVAARGLAVAACSALKREYRDRLVGCVSAAMRFVLLDNDPEILGARLVERRGHYMPPSLLASQIATLERPGADEPVLTLETDVAPERLVLDALDWLARPIEVRPFSRRV